MRPGHPRYPLFCSLDERLASKSMRTAGPDKTMPQDLQLSVSKRLIYAFLGLLAGEAALLLILLHAFSLLTLHDAFSLFMFYAVFSLIAWVLVGLPIAVAVPAQVVTDMPWPLWLLIAVLSGPLALSLILLLLGHGSLVEFAHTASTWPMSVLVSTVCAVVYRALLRKQAGLSRGERKTEDTAETFNLPNEDRRSVGTRSRLLLIAAAALLVAAFVAYLGLFSGTLEHSVRIQKQMTWESAPEEYKSAFYAKPDEYVRFRFVENPHCFEVESAKDLGAELRQAGTPVVSVEFEVWGGSHGVRGHRMLAVDGRPLRDVGGWGSSGSNDYSGPCPISKAMH